MSSIAPHPVQIGDIFAVRVWADFDEKKQEYTGKYNMVVSNTTRWLNSNKTETYNTRFQFRNMLDGGREKIRLSLVKVHGDIDSEMTDAAREDWKKAFGLRQGLEFLSHAPAYQENNYGVLVDETFAILGKTMDDKFKIKAYVGGPIIKADLRTLDPSSKKHSEMLARDPRMVAFGHGFEAK